MVRGPVAPERAGAAALRERDMVFRFVLSGEVKNGEGGTGVDAALYPYYIRRRKVSFVKLLILLDDLVVNEPCGAGKMRTGEAVAGRSPYFVAAPFAAGRAKVSTAAPLGMVMYCLPATM